MELSLENICSFSKILNSSLNMKIWEIINSLSAYYLFIILALFLWIIFELFTKNGTTHYNSVNGFSPTFNKFIGSGVYFLYFNLFLVIPVLIFGEIVYCITLPFITHLLIFFLVKITLLKLNFWKY